MLWKELGSNIIKLEGYGIYVTYVDSNLYVCDIIPRTGLPTLDPDKCIEWTELKEPANQQFLNLINTKFGTAFTMPDFELTMSITDIKEHSKVQKAIRLQKSETITPSELRWMVKNMREKSK